MRRIAGAARLLATGKLAQSSGFEGAQIQRRLMAWRAGGESINSLIQQGGELQRSRARQLVRSNPYASNASASLSGLLAPLGRGRGKNQWRSGCSSRVLR